MGKMIKQRTLKNVIKTTGIGVHTGKKVHLTLRPAAPNTGIIFRRPSLDLKSMVEIPAKAENVGDTRLSTCLVKDKEGVRIGIATVEHLMAACAGLGVDNLYADLTTSEGPENSISQLPIIEVPIMDGSAAPLVFLLQSAGIEEQNALKKFIRIKKTIVVEDGDKKVSLKPFEGFRVSFTIDFNHPAFCKNHQSASFDFSTSSFKEISRARTFGFLREIEELQKNNLGLGGSLDNAIIIDEFRVMNEEGLRYPDEFVKHKILDAVGDLYLLGYNLIGAFIGHKSGHKLNNQVLRQLLADQSAWEIVTFTDPAQVPMSFIPAFVTS